MRLWGSEGLQRDVEHLILLREALERHFTRLSFFVL